MFVSTVGASSTTAFGFGGAASSAAAATPASAPFSFGGAAGGFGFGGTFLLKVLKAACLCIKPLCKATQMEYRCERKCLA